MEGLRIRKTLRAGNTTTWPDGYRLDGILRPVADALRSLWWETTDARYTIPPEWFRESRPPAVDGGPNTVGSPELDQFDAAFVPGTKVARPGFLPSFAPIISGDWSILYGFRDNPLHDPDLIARSLALDWFAPPTAFPAPVTVVIRSVDWAYWEIFARDAAIVDTVRVALSEVEGLMTEPPS